MRSLERITVAGALGGGAPAGGEDLFAYGGSVGHLSAVDCTGDGGVVISTATPGAARSEAEQGIYDVERLRYGALLFRGFGVDGTEGLQRLVRSICGDLLEYRERSSWYDWR